MVIRLIVGWVIFAISIIFALLCFGAGVETIKRNKDARFPNRATPAISFSLGLLVLYFTFTHMPQDAIYDGDIRYVNLFTDENDVKNYRVPGLILKDEYGYHLYEVYWPNGGTTTFDGSSTYTDLIIGEKVSATDDDDRAWYVELTKEKAEAPN